MIDQYSAGKTVYKGGLPNAQSGTLDPSGYINRESNRRSGLAALAMAKRSGAQSVPGGKPTKKTFNEAGLFVSPIGKIGRLK
jgi:hypothetical protein